jgi:hypothetical protein
MKNINSPLSVILAPIVKANALRVAKEGPRPERTRSAEQERRYYESFVEVSYLVG